MCVLQTSQEEHVLQTAQEEDAVVLGSLLAAGCGGGADWSPARRSGSVITAIQKSQPAHIAAYSRRVKAQLFHAVTLAVGYVATGN